MPKSTVAFYGITFPGSSTERQLCVACSELACIRMPGVPQWKLDTTAGACHNCGAKHRDRLELLRA